VKRDHWKQDTPQMQAVALMAGIRGQIENLKDGISSPAGLQNLEWLLDDLQALHQEELPEAWAGQEGPMPLPPVNYRLRMLLVKWIRARHRHAERGFRAVGEIAEAQDELARAVETWLEAWTHEAVKTGDPA